MESLAQPREIITRIYSDIDLALPKTQIISNGTYSVMTTASGSGFSKCGDLMITRWREDPTRDHWGQFFYIQDCTKGKVWSAGIQPIVY